MPDKLDWVINQLKWKYHLNLSIRDQNIRQVIIKNSQVQLKGDIGMKKNIYIRVKKDTKYLADVRLQLDGLYIKLEYRTIHYKWSINNAFVKNELLY